MRRLKQRTKKLAVKTVLSRRRIGLEQQCRQGPHNNGTCSFSNTDGLLWSKYPNPIRKDCPNIESLQELVEEVSEPHQLRQDVRWRQALRCSPCFEEYFALRHNRSQEGHFADHTLSVSASQDERQKNRKTAAPQHRTSGAI